MLSGLTAEYSFYTHFNTRSCGRVAEGGGLLNRYTLQRRIEGSNPSGSASLLENLIGRFGGHASAVMAGRRTANRSAGFPGRVG
jgi:hypothetical protein